jgi:hypothetical protein
MTDSCIVLNPQIKQMNAKKGTSADYADYADLLFGFGSFEPAERAGLGAAKAWEYIFTANTFNSLNLRNLRIVPYSSNLCNLRTGQEVQTT